MTEKQKLIVPTAKNHFDENLLLAGIVNLGREGFAECCDLVNQDTFSSFVHASLFASMSNLFNEGRQIGLLSVFQGSGLSPESFEECKSILTGQHVNLNDIRPTALKLKKAKIKEQAINVHRNCISELTKLDGTEPISRIIQHSEKALFDLVSSITSSAENNPIKIGDIARKQVEDWMMNPVQNVGLPLPWPKFNASIGGGLRSGVHIVGARLKALRHGSKVYTDDGPKLIENIKVGDTVKHPFKGNTTVTAVWPHKNINIYRVHFRDGDFVDCCEDHLWHVTKRRYGIGINKKDELKTTKELINDLTYGKRKEYKWDVPLPNPVEFTEKEVPIDPYVIGVLLGDGSVSNNTCVYHTADEEIHQYMSSYAKSIGCEVKIDSNRADNKCTSYRINSMQDLLKESGIWGLNCYNKKIPKDYIYNSKEVRLSVLAGLLDTDGTCVIDKKSNQSRTRFSSVSKELCLGIKEIVQSLGGLCSITNVKSKCNDKAFDSFACEVRLPQGINPFRLKRKANKFTERVIGPLKRTIVKIEKIATDDATCITLSENDGLFMTDNYVVTHNTGKTSIGLMTALHAASLGIPVLILDTEMMIKDVLPRILASLSEVEINHIERGIIVKDELKKKKVFNSVEFLEKANISHRNVGGYDFDEIVSTIRRWIYTDVGLRDSGEAQPMLVIFDYFKVMNAKELTNINETQALGFQVTKLVDFSKKYDFPTMSFAQLNREGIDREDSAAIGNSDRIAQLANSISLFKRKTEKEIQKDGIELGNRKLLTTDSRYGGEMEFKEDYINMLMKKEYCILQEVNCVRQPDAKF